jgi:hypothetical protein
MLKERACMKQDVYSNIQETFSLLKACLSEIADELSKVVVKMDKRVHVEYQETGEMACQLTIAGDIIIFHMHTNVFKLDRSHSLWKSSYLAEDEMRGYFGVINMYNFLADSFRYNRERDIGYLVSRMFLNKDGKFFMQGKRQLGYLYNDLANSEIDRDRMKAVLNSVILYVIDFDLLMPRYDHVSKVSVYEMRALSANMQLSTGKRLGFRFQADSEDIV